MASSKNIPILKLNNGVSMPALGFGTFAKDGVPGKIHAAVLTALDAGYRHLDCAWYYLNEAEVGSALKQWLARNPDAKREDIFITTKVWPHLMEPEDIEWSLNNSLKMLGLEYVDCFLLHWPFVCEKTEEKTVKLGSDNKYIIKRTLDSAEDFAPIWGTMEKLYKLGKTRSIGVSNWTILGLESLLRVAEIKPAVNQVEIHPFLPNTSLISYCTSHGILPVAYSPLGSQLQVAYTGETVMGNEVLKGIAEKRGVSVAQILISWGLKRGYAVLPMSGSEERIKKNFQVVELSDEEFEDINNISKGINHRFVNLKETFGFDVWAEDE